MLKHVRQKRVLLLTLFVIVAGSVAGRNLLLRSAGNLLMADDPLQPADIAIMTTDAGYAGAIELADLAAKHLTKRVGALVPEPSLAERELASRGVTIPERRQLLEALRVPLDAIEIIPAGEGGTTEGIEALAAWCQEHGIQRVIVVTGPDHGRRVKRALRRAFGERGPEVLIHRVTHSSFRASDWWQNRQTLRSGLIELQKLVLDFAQHPLSGW